MYKKKKSNETAVTRREFLRRSSMVGVAAGLPNLSWAVRGDELHIRNYVDVSSLDAPFSLSGGDGLITDAIFQKLVKFKTDDTWDTELDAAEYFEAIDDTRYAFRLKPGQVYSNGFGEMTADDVKYSYERVVDPDVNAINAVDMGTLSHVEVHDRYSGTIVLKSPYAAFVSIGVTSFPIMSRAAMESVGGRFGIEPPCCSGPYLFRSWQSKRKTILERNPQWDGPDAAFSEIHVYAMTDEKPAEMAFESGQLDCAQISVESVEPFRENMPPNSDLEVYPSGRNYWLGMNKEHPALQDIRVRRAIQYAVDANAVVEAAWFGLAEPSTGPIPKGVIGHREQGQIPPQGNLEKARELLAEAGVELPLKIRLDVNNDSLEMTAVQVIQWSLRKVGIEVEIRAYENSVFLTVGREDLGDQWKDLQLYFQSFVGSADPYYSMVWFTSQQLGQWNWERFSNEEFDRLNDEALATSDPVRRARMYQRMQDLMEESGCYRFISNGAMPQIVRRTVKSAFSPDGYAMLRGFRPAGSNS